MNSERNRPKTAIRGLSRPIFGKNERLDGVLAAVKGFYQGKNKRQKQEKDKKSRRIGVYGA